MAWIPIKLTVDEVADHVYPLTVEEYENAEILDDDVYVLITGEEVEVE